MKKVVYIFGLALMTMLGCANDSEDDLIEPPTIIDDGEQVTYTENIQSIMQDNCTLCHSNPPVNGASMALVTFENVKNAVENSGLINRISRQAGESGAMPPGGTRLPQNLIDLVSQWQADGFVE